MMRVRGNKLIWALFSVLLCSATLLAQSYADVARNTGYRDGLEKGRIDARDGDSYNLQRHDAYKDADHGYRDSFRSKEAYKRVYREAFTRGYKEGYTAGGGPGRGRGRGWGLGQGNRSGGGPVGNRPGDISRPGNSMLVDTARNTGYRDGLDKGRNDARQRKSFNLDRHDAWKDADHGYRDSFGNKDQYKQIYRDNFRRGYEEGYRRGR